MSFDTAKRPLFKLIGTTASCGTLPLMLLKETNMDAIREPSVDELRRESERTRAQLTDTVEHLRDKVGETASEIRTMVSPAHIKQEIRTYVREEREHLTETVQRKIREIPCRPPQSAPPSPTRRGVCSVRSPCR